MLFEFVLPCVDFGLGDLRTERKTGSVASFVVDRLEFVIEGRTWVLRKLVRTDSALYPVDVAAALATSENVPFQVPQLEQTCLLQVPDIGWSFLNASKTADEVCWMLQIALGQRVAWNQAGRRVGTEFHFLQGRTVLLPECVNRGGAIRNEGRNELRTFLEAFHPIYRKSEQWWRITADWYAIARESKIVQVGGLVSSMLLDRVTLFCIKDQKLSFPKQIEDVQTDLTENSPDRVAFEELIDEVMQALVSKKWNKSRAIAARIKEMIDQPPYDKKVEAVFEHYNLTPPSAITLRNRNSLAHNGELSSKTKDLRAYHDEIIGSITSLLLKMAHYGGRYFVPGSGVKKM